MDWLNGKKTYIGVVAWGINQILKLVFPHLAVAWGVLDTLTLTLTGVGVGHKLAKAGGS